jgi:hypothetical protein
MVTGYVRGSGDAINSTYYIWQKWTDTYTTTTTSSTETVWSTWASNTTTSTIDVWTEWNGTASSVVYTRNREPYRPPPPRAPESPAVIKQRQEAIAAAVLAKRIAEQRAEELLLRVLDQRQKEDFKKHGHFFVFGKNRTRYRIRKGRVGNVDVVNRSGIIDHRLCFHPNDHEMPDIDVMLAQKLHLEHDEAGCLRIANVHASNPGQVVAEPLH